MLGDVSLDIPLRGHYNDGRGLDAIREGEAQGPEIILLPCGKQTRGEKGEAANYPLPRH